MQTSDALTLAPRGNAAESSKPANITAARHVPAPGNRYARQHDYRRALAASGIQSAPASLHAQHSWQSTPMSLRLEL
jgi:hypothetical protein